MKTNTTTDNDLHIDFKENRLVGLWQLLRGFRWPYLGANLSLAISAAAKTSTYLFLAYFIDNILYETANYNILFVIAFAFIGLAIIEGGFTFISGRLAAYTAENVTRRLRNYLFDHIQRLPFAYHDKTQTGELIQRSTSDVDALRRFFSEQAIGIGRIFLLFSINFIAILNLNVTLAFASIIVVPFIIIASIFFFKRITKAYEAYQVQDATLSTTLQENLSGVRVVKAFARQEHERQKFEKDNWEKYLRGRKLLTMHSLFWPVTDIICGAQMLAGFFLGATMAINGTISVGTYLAYSGLVVWLIWPMRNLGRLIVQTSTGMVSFSRVMEIIKQVREELDGGIDSSKKRLQGKIIFDQVSFSYNGDDHVLHDISFECQPGQVIALMGPTGSGKTTLVNLLPRFYEYTSGKIFLDGVELKEFSRGYLRQNIGIVEQEPFLFSRTIRENICYGVGREVDDAEIEAAARAAAIHEVIQAFPDGYNTIVGERGVTLSGGQKQRVAIARTLLKDPLILILDDSTSSIDSETESEIRMALEHLMQNRTTFVIAHRIQSVMNADLIVVMDNGKIVQKGNHDQLLEQDGIYRQIYDIQARIEIELEKEVSSREFVIDQFATDTLASS